MAMQCGCSVHSWCGVVIVMAFTTVAVVLMVLCLWRLVTSVCVGALCCR
jgi:hypothetical protein